MKKTIRLLLATRKGLFELEPQTEAAWSVSDTAFLGDPVTLAFHDSRSGHAYAALNHGHFGVKLHRRLAGQSDWQEIETPAYPPFPEGREPDRCPFRGIEIPWKLEQIWALAPGGEDQPGRIWCGSLPGGLFKSDDHGDSWQFVDSLWNVPERAKWAGGGYDFPGIHSIAVDPRDSRRVVVGISCGGIWETSDDGGTWKLIGQGLRAEYMPPELAYDPVAQDPHYLVSCPAQPERIWVQHHNGIFRSDDGGKTFSEIKDAGPSVFGFAVAVHPQDPDTAWFVPAIKDEQRIPVDGKLVVTRTRDGGKHFQTLGNGLPQTHAYDLVYRHALAVDDTGDRLAFGSTTGSLWTSDDQGDTWQLASAHFPPINSVSFYQ
ncbi:exo-alpha-sialidase [Pelagicoccus sp. SDUM812003]|uniref:WD40/YVTN/BNR-like repeat-containing protein n=1 Tax=Pelagicoccus sp. SDUM812003 TaxID=3041267 RepID=UPI0031F31165